MLPLGLGYIEWVTHDDKRHGTNTLFAALDVLNGTVLATCKPRHRHPEFLSFLRRIDQSVPQKLDIHVIVDNYSPHTHAGVKARLTRHPRWHFPFIPTYSSWLNQVERFFKLITEKAIRHGSFGSVKDLVRKIDHFIAQYNQHRQPFIWAATVEGIVPKISQARAKLEQIQSGSTLPRGKQAA